MELNFWRLTEGDDRGPGPTLGLGGVLHPGDARMATQGLADRRFQFSGAMAMDDADEPGIAQFYQDKFRKSSLVEGAYEAEDYFPTFGERGRWLYFTAAPLRDSTGRLIGAIETLQDFTERRRAEPRRTELALEGQRPLGEGRPVAAALIAVD